MGPKPNPPPEREKRKGINETAFFAENEKTKVNADIFASPKPGKTDLQEVDISDKPPTFRYFHAPIKGHPDYKDGVVTDDTIEPSQVIVSEGRVVGIEVDPEVAHQLNQEKQTTANLCQCCRDNDYEIGRRLKTDIKVQRDLIAKVLLMECLLRIPAALMLAAQQIAKPVQRFMYTQWGLSLVFICVFMVVIVWSVECSDLGRQHPCNNILLVVKAILQAEISCTATAITQRLVLLTKLSIDAMTEEFDGEPLSWTILETVQKDEKLYFSYPVIVHLVLINLTIMSLVQILFFKCMKGNIKNDGMLWLASLTQILVTILGLALLVVFTKPYEDEKAVKKPYNKTLLFVGPFDYDMVQILFTGFGALAWELWRLYDLRQVIEGKRYNLDVHEAKFVVLNFCAL